MRRFARLPVSFAAKGVLALAAWLAAAQSAMPTPNPRYQIDPQVIFPSPASLIPHGVSYTDTVPDTLDLAERAKQFLRGASADNVPFENIWLPGGQAYFSPANRIHDPSCIDKAPCLGFTEGYPNWGKIALGFILAREISGYDLNDANGTLSGEYRSITTMLDWDTVVALRSYAREHPDLKLGGMNLTVADRAITPATTIMQALSARYLEDPSNQALRSAIGEFLRMHQQVLSPHQVDGMTRYDYLDPSTDVTRPGQLETQGGYWGRYSGAAYTNGRAAIAMFQWYALTGDRVALDIGTKLTNALRSFAQQLWANPDPSRFDNSTAGSFAGHMHSYLQVPLAFVAEASVRLKANPQDAVGRQDLEVANNAYEFIKHRTRGDVLGNFGATTPTEDMIRLGIYLSELGVGPYWEEVERWIRNTLADRQIDPVTAQRYIGNRTTGDYNTDHVGDKVTGLWFSDATHSLAVPERAWMFDVDNATDPMHAFYEVWAHTIDLRGDIAVINFDLNRAGRFLDVKSDLPYRGQITIDMKRDIGPISSLEVRIPSWADRDRVSITLQDAAGAHTLAQGSDWSWKPNLYVHVARVAPDAAIIVRFPIKVYQMRFQDMRSGRQFWYEGDYGSPSQHAEENVQTSIGVFRGDTMVDARPRPTDGVPRYQRQALAALPPTDVAPPMITVQRFVPSNPHTP
jgi:hypothetical protein